MGREEKPQNDISKENRKDQKEKTNTGTGKRQMTTTSIYLKWDKSTGYR